AAQVDRRRPGAVRAIPRRHPDVLGAERAGPVGREDDPATFLAHVGLGVHRPAAQRGDQVGWPKGPVAVSLALVDVAAHGRAAWDAAREVERRSAGLHVRGALLVERAIRAAVLLTAEMLRRLPTSARVEPGQVDVAPPARHALNLAAADEEQPTAADRRRAEIGSG